MERIFGQKGVFFIFVFFLVLNLLVLSPDHSVVNNSFVLARSQSDDCSKQQVPGVGRKPIYFPQALNYAWVCSEGGGTEVYEAQCYAREFRSVALCTDNCSGGRCAGGTNEDGGTASKDCEGETIKEDRRTEIKFPAMRHGETACEAVGNIIYGGICRDGDLITDKCDKICENGICDELEHPDEGVPGGSTGPTGPGLGGAAPPEITGVLPVIYNAIKFFFSFIAVIAAAMVVYGAYMWMFSGGDPQKVKLAQGTLTWAIIGLIFFIMIVVFFDFILRLFGITMPMPTDTGIF